MYRTTALVALAATIGCAAPVDRDAEEAALRQADMDFMAATTARGAEGWADFFAIDGAMFPGSGRIDGRAAIQEFMAGAFTPGVPSLIWEPTTAVVSESGDLGYTLGRYRTLTPEGEVTSEGNYVSIWRKVDGEWRVAVDIGNTDPPPDSTLE